MVKKNQNMKMANLKSKELLSNEVAISASIIAKDKNIRDIVHNFSANAHTNHLIDIKGLFWTEEI